MAISGRKQALINRFYRELQKWIDDGCKKHPAFRKNSAICENSFNWVRHNFPKSSNHWWMCSFLGDAFADEGLDRTLPFNNFNNYKYNHEHFKGTSYKNPYRLKWIKDHQVSGARKRGPNDILRNYLRRLQTWVENGCHKHPIFRIEYGICDNVKTLGNHSEEESAVSTRLALKKKLPKPEQGDECFPFNNGCIDHYSCEVRDETLWKNEARLKWLRENCA